MRAPMHAAVNKHTQHVRIDQRAHPKSNSNMNTGAHVFNHARVHSRTRTHPHPPIIKYPIVCARSLFHIQTLVCMGSCMKTSMHIHQNHVHLRTYKHMLEHTCTYILGGCEYELWSVYEYILQRRCVLCACMCNHCPACVYSHVGACVYTHNCMRVCLHACVRTYQCVCVPACKHSNGLCVKCGCLLASVRTRVCARAHSYKDVCWLVNR